MGTILVIGNLKTWEVFVFSSSVFKLVSTKLPYFESKSNKKDRAQGLQYCGIETNSKQFKAAYYCLGKALVSDPSNLASEDCDPREKIEKSCILNSPVGKLVGGFGAEKMRGKRFNIFLSLLNTTTF